MKIPVKTLKNGFSLPVYGLGTWMMGGKNTHDPHNNDEADIRAIREAIDHGITHIDTSELYAEGYTEVLIGQAIKRYEREKLFLVSKFSETHAAYKEVHEACEGSLQRLQTDYLDLYMIHISRFIQKHFQTPLEETMQAVTDLKKKGVIKHIGVSNFTKERLREAQAYTPYPIVANQVHYNLMYREPEKNDLVKYCQRKDIMLIAWRPVQQGILTHETDVVRQLCSKYHKTPTQIALNWLLSQKNVVTLSKTGSIDHLKENLGAVGWQMEKENIERLRSDFPDQQFISDTVPLV